MARVGLLRRVPACSNLANRLLLCPESTPNALTQSAPWTSAADAQSLDPFPFTAFWAPARGLHTQKRLSVVLRTHIEGLGRPGDIVQVAPGYARNLLIPYKLAFPALDKYINEVRAAKEAGVFAAPVKSRSGEVEDSGPGGETAETPGRPVALEEGVTGLPKPASDTQKEAEEVARRLDASRLSIRRIAPRRSNALRHPVGADDIVSEVRRQLGISLTPRNVALEAPFKAIGMYEVPLRFPRDVELPGGKEQFVLKVNVRRK